MTVKAGSNRSPMPSVLDREIHSLEADAFGHEHFAEALRNLLESESNTPPFSVGLLGSWGTGKSTIKELYLSGLRGDQSKAGGRPRRDRFHAVTFNAWRYGGEEDMKRSLLRHVFLELGGDEEVLRRELYQQVQRSTGTAKGFWEWTKEAVLQNLVSVATFVVLLAAVLIAVYFFASRIGLTNQVGLSILGPAAITVAVFLAKYVVDIRLKSPSLFHPMTTIQFPRTSAEEYELLLLEQLRRFKEGSKGRYCRRLLVFVDDLDRLSAAEMVSGLDAVRTFMELPPDRLPPDIGVIFVISCDEDRVAEALARGRGRLGAGDLPGSVFTRSDARRYLDRLFQFRLEIPHFPKRDMRRFAREKLEQMDPICDSLAELDVRVDDVVDRLIHVGVQSPRNAIQILNAFAQAWWIARERERDGVGSDRPGVLHAGAVTKHPLSLAALCVLRVDFPDFYSRLQERPDLLGEFSGVVFGATDPGTLPKPAQQALARILSTDEDGRLQKEVKEAHRPLRQYLASLQGTRWPNRLRPMLLLSEDAITRRYGERAGELHDAFVSGDTSGVLDVLGRDLDDKSLSTEDVGLIEDLLEAVAQDTESRRVNASRVVTDLVDRIPARYRRRILTPLARQLIDLKQVRMRIGPSRAAAVVPHISHDDQRDVAAQYCNDVLSDDVIDFELPTGESPNLDELTSIVTEACGLVLSVRHEAGLPSRAEQTLLAWLTTRHVRLGEKSTSLPFQQLDAWVSTYESTLLPAMGEHYSDLAIAEFEASKPFSLDAEQVLRRIRTVHDQLAAQGEESRRTLWSQLQRLVAVHDAAAVSAAWETSAQYADLGLSRETSDFMAAMAGRLQKELDGRDAWALDRESGGQYLVQLIGRWNEEFGEEAIESISSLIKAWGKTDQTATLAARTLRLVQTHHQIAAEAIMDGWTDVEFGAGLLPWPVRELVASQAEMLTDEQRTSVVKRLDEVIAPNAVQAEVSEEYTRFVKAVPGTGWQLPPFRKHVDRLFSRTEAMFQNQNEYLTRLFPAAKSLLHCGPRGRGGAMLQALFAQAAEVPDAYTMLHGEMAGSWPAADEQVGDYGADALFDVAVQFIQQSGSAAAVDRVLLSLGDLCRREIVSETKRKALAKCVVQLWPAAAAAVQEISDVFAAHLAAEDVCAFVAQSEPLWSESDVDVSAVVQRIADSKALPERRKATLHILQAPPKSMADQPDGALAVWLSAVVNDERAILADLLNSADLNDSQKKRAFRLALARRSNLGLSFFVDTMPRQLADPALKSTRAAVLEANSEISSLAKSLDEKTHLAESLITVLPSVSGEDQAVIARWIRDLGGQAAMERASTIIQELGAQGLEIVVKEFPGSRQLKKALNSAQRTQTS